MSYIAICSIIYLEFPENDELYQGYLTFAGGMGFTVGPALATILIRYFDYMGTNLIFASLILIIGLAGVFSLPARINEDHSQETDAEEEVASRDVPYSAFFKNKSSLMSLIAHVVRIMLLQFIDPILSLHMEDLA